MIFNETCCTQPSFGKGEVVSSILTGSTMKIPPLVRVFQMLHTRPAAGRITSRRPHPRIGKLLAFFDEAILRAQISGIASQGFRS